MGGSGRWALRCAAIAVLAAALVFFNRPSAVLETEPRETVAAEVPTGSEPGERPQDFTLQLLSGEKFTLSEHRGKVTVINLWATWCTPCVNELPHFDRLQREYPEEVTVLAIHSDLITDDVAGYLFAFAYGIGFAVDGNGKVIASLGGSTMLPQTIILDADGVVTYNRVGSLTYEALEELFLEAR